MADDPYRNTPSDLDDPATDGWSVVIGTPYVIPARELYVGTSGDVVVTAISGNDVLFKNVPAGTRLAIRHTKVTNATTASNLTALV